MHTCERLPHQELAHVAQLIPWWTGGWAWCHPLPCAASPAPYKDLHHMVLMAPSLLTQVGFFFHRGGVACVLLGSCQEQCVWVLLFSSHLCSFFYYYYLEHELWCLGNGRIELVCWIMFSPLPAGGKAAPPSHICYGRIKSSSQVAIESTPIPVFF